MTFLGLSPLVQLPRLSSLHLQDALSVVQCAAIKRLAALTVLGSVNWDRDGLLALLQPPHALHRL